jgi:hypothetical protein
MRVIALIEDPAVVRAILTHLGSGSRRRSSAPRRLPRGPGPSTPICRSLTTLCPTSPETALRGSLAPERGFVCVIQARAGKMRHHADCATLESTDERA